MLDQIWLSYKRIDGTNDGTLDIKYEKVPNYCIYYKIQGNIKSQYWTKARQDRIKL